MSNTSQQDTDEYLAFCEYLEESSGITLGKNKASLVKNRLRSILEENNVESLADAYALIKTLNRDHRVQRFQIVVNKVQSEAEGCDLFERLRSVSEQYIDVVLRLKAIIPHDDNILRAARQRRPFYSTYPDLKAIKSFKKLAADVDNQSKSAKVNGRLMFFAEKMIGLQDSMPSRAMP